MSNKIYAKEWLQFAYKNLDTAQKLYDLDHYTDIIGVELQQALEKMIKAYFAYHNIKIPKTHKLLELIAYLDDLDFNDHELTLLETATNYYRVDRYPNPNYVLPTKSEIKNLLEFTNELFQKICHDLKIKIIF